MATSKRDPCSASHAVARAACGAHQTRRPLAQVVGIAAVVVAVGGQEDHVRAFATQQPHQVAQAHRARITVGPRGQRVDHQDLALSRVQARRRRHVRRTQARERVAAVGEEDLAVAQLVGLDPAGRVGARAGAFVVHDPCRRLVKDPAARRAHGKRDVGVFVVGRGIAVSKPPSRGPRARQGAGAPRRVDVAQVGVARVGRIAERVFLALRRGNELHRPLKAAVGIQDLVTDQACVERLMEVAPRASASLSGDGSFEPHRTRPLPSAPVCRRR